MPNSFALTPEGILLVASGFDKVLRWDGLTPQAQTAGVPPPGDDEAIVLAGSGAAATGAGITGDYQAYLRYVDRFGNYSNLSPVSNTLTVTDVTTIEYSSLATPSDPKIVRRQILRNTAGQLETFYVDIDTTDLTSSSLSSTRLDEELAEQESQVLLNDDGTPLANGRTVPPDTKAFVAHHLNRMYLAGEQEYSEGNVVMTFGSTTVTGIGTEWTEVLPGRFLFVVGAERSYEIASVSVDLQTLTLLEPYESASDPYARYAIRPEAASRRTVQFSEAGEPESWPATNGFTLTEDGDTITGLMAKGSFLYILERSNIYRFTAQSDPRRDGFVFHSANRGCVNHRCWTVVDEAAYLLDELGVHRFTGGEEWASLSDPISDFFDGSGDQWRINWKASRYFHCVRQPGEDVIRWFVALSGEYLPRHALCYQYRDECWWVEEYPVPVGASCLGRLGSLGSQAGLPQVYLGSEARRVLAQGQEYLDGAVADAGTTRGTATSATLVTLTDTGASFASLVGVPVVIVSGAGKGQRRLIASNTTTTLTVTMPWLALPDSTSVYQVGGVPWTYRTGWFRFYNDGEQDTPRRVEVLFEPRTEESSFDLRARRDRRTSYLTWDVDRTSDEGDGVAATAGATDLVCNLQQENGFVQQRLDHHKEWYANGPRYAQWELRGVANKERVRFFQILLDGHIPPSSAGGGGA